jgi:hypothetical protein
MAGMIMPFWIQAMVRKFKDVATLRRGGLIPRLFGPGKRMGIYEIMFMQCTTAVNLKFKIEPTGFKHTGLFPEQAVNRDWMTEKIKSAGS